MAFMDKDFLLKNEVAKKLYHGYAADLPVIDYHCHVDAKEIAQNRRFSNIAQLWLSGDHYKWRLMRAAGEDESVITGSGSDYDKFLAFARTLPKAAGNPVYHWAHLELRRYFDCELILSESTADEIWRITGEKLADADFSVRGIIKRSKVEVIGTTDDPTDSLEWHRKIAEDSSFDTKVIPTFRPDRALNIESPGYWKYLELLGNAAEINIKTIDDLYEALENRIDFFNKAGCRASDHGLLYIPYIEDAEEQAEAVFRKAQKGKRLSIDEIDAFMTAMLLYLGRAYAERGWIMQIHYGVMRSINTWAYDVIGPDTGFDAIAGRGGEYIAPLLDELAQTNELPKTVLYSLDPNDDAMLDTVCGGFTNNCFPAHVQHGSAWWFNDTKQGMEAQLTSLASRGLLGGFIGMLTDSRSFLSYPRHEYFRRILCNLLGEWVELGEFPNDLDALGKLVQDVSYYNVKTFFGF
jgi:glucuronate isomerase